MSEIEVISENPIEIQLQEEALRLVKLKAKWNGCKSTLAPIANALSLLGIEPRFNGDLDVCFTGDKEKFTAAMRILRVAGFTPSNPNRPKKGDTGWHSFFNKPDCTVQILLNFTSSVCKRVKVGTKTVEQDVYEVQCGDISDGETQATIEAPVIAIEHTTEEFARDIPF